MSAVIKTLTPFTEQDILLEALAAMGVTANLQGNRIMTQRTDYQGQQYFQRIDGSYRLVHDSDELNGRVISNSLKAGYTPVKRFLEKLEAAYKTAYYKKLERIAEAERQRLEQERQARVEKTRLEAIAKAKAQGYTIRETRKNGKIQLVLTRTVF